jgi:sulfur carrier protein
MRIEVNGEAREVTQGITVAGLLHALGITGDQGGPVAVEKNREIIPRAEHASHELHDGDVLEVVHFVGGG